MNSLKKAYLFAERLIPGILFVSIFFVMLMEIASRLIFRKSFEWNTEYCRYALVWVTFIGAIYVRRDRSHIQVTALYDYLMEKKWTGALWVIDLIREIALIAFWGMLAYFGYQLSMRTARFSSSALGISQFWLYICTAVCGVMGGLMELNTLYRLFTRGWEPPPKQDIEQIPMGD